MGQVMRLITGRLIRWILGRVIGEEYPQSGQLGSRGKEDATRVARKVAPQNSLKPVKLQLFGITFKPLEVFKNGEIKTGLRLDSKNHVAEVLS